MKNKYSKIRAAIPKHPGLLASSAILPLGSLLLLSAFAWNYYRNSKNTDHKD